MTTFDFPDFDGHEHVSLFADETSGLRAVIAIHSTAPFGISGGGCRMCPYDSTADAIRDALKLSLAMSRKLALTGMPAGGAKAVVVGDPRTDKTPALLRALGRAVDRLGGRYVIAEDVGTTPEDMRIVGEETRYVSGRAQDTGPATAHGVFVGLRDAVRRRLGRDLDGVRVAVQGVGNVGGRLCAELRHAGADLVVSDTNERALERLRDELGDVAVLSPERILAADVDVVAPCALGSVLDDASIEALRCQVVAGSANDQLASPRHADALARRNILYAPDFVINAGGVIGAAFEGVGTEGDIDTTAVMKEVERVRELLDRVFERAAHDGTNPHAAAVGIADEALRLRRASGAPS